MPNILCRFVSKHGMLFLCMELLALPTAADGNETKFKEMGEDSFGIATFVRAEEARDRILVGEEGAEKQKPFKSSSSPAKRAVQVASSSTSSFSSKVSVYKSRRNLESFL